MLRITPLISKQIKRRVCSSSAPRLPAKTSIPASTITTSARALSSKVNEAKYKDIMDFQASYHSTRSGGASQYFSYVVATVANEQDDVYSNRAPILRQQQPMISQVHRSMDDCEDYDAYELHHPPCEMTRESYYDASYDPAPLGV